MLRNFEFRIYPSKKQQSVMTDWMVKCCELYNACLEQRKAAWSRLKHKSPEDRRGRMPNFISQSMTLRMLDELIDLVPLNKIIAFGGDYRVVVQKVYGHLVMARETVARALARRVADGDFSEERALEIAKMWFCDNPARIYRV